jgi:transposase InsO family protein
VSSELRDKIIDFINYWSEKTEISSLKFGEWLGISRSKFYDWHSRYGKVNEHNGKIPRDFWLEEWERQAILNYHFLHPLDGYRRLSFMMLDENIVGVSPTTVYRVLKSAGVLDNKPSKESLKGAGFVQPIGPHEHWHIDVSYLNLGGTFYYLCSILDGYSRKVLHWEIKPSMTENEIEIIIERAKEKNPGFSPRIISDNGPQFISRDFKEYIRISGMTHVKTSPYYPQSNGKIERWHKEMKQTIRPKNPRTVDEAKEMLNNFIDYYNNKRLHSALGYISPQDYLVGRSEEIHKLRDERLELARENRRDKRKKINIAAENKVIGHFVNDHKCVRLN